MAFRKFLSVALSFEMACVLFIFSGRIKAIGFTSVGGLDLTLLSACLVAALVGIGLHSKKYIISFESKAVILSALILVTYLATSLMWSPVSSYSLHKFSYIVTFVPLAYVGGLVCGSEPKRLYRFLLALVLFTVVYLLVAMAMSGGWESLVYKDLVASINIQSDDSLSLYQQNSNLTALAGAICLMLTYLNSKRRPYAIFYFCLTVALVSLTVGLGGRAGILRLLVAALVLLLFSGRFRFLKFIIVTAIIVIVALLIAVHMHFLIELAAWEFLPEGIARLITITLETNLLDGGEARVGLGLAAFYVWLDNPVFGVGLGGYPTAANLLWEFGYPHNIFLEILSESGLFGISIFLFFLYMHTAVVVRSLIKNPKDRVSLVKLLVFSVSLSVSIFSSDLTDREYPFFFGLLAVAVLGSSSVAKKQRRPNA